MRLNWDLHLFKKKLTCIRRVWSIRRVQGDILGSTQLQKGEKKKLLISKKCEKMPFGIFFSRLPNKCKNILVLLPRHVYDCCLSKNGFLNCRKFVLDTVLYGLCGIKITEVAGKIPHDHAFYVLLKRTSWEVVLKIKMPRIKQCFASRFFFAFSKNRLMAYRMRSDRTTPQK